jgi:hypothetical protein
MELKQFPDLLPMNYISFLNKYTSIEITNTNEYLVTMIDVVQKSISLKKKTYDNIPIVHFKNNNELYDFLARI